MRYRQRRGKYLLNRKQLRLHQSWKTISRDDRKDLISLLKVLGVITAVIAALYFIGISGLTYINDFWKIFTGETGPTAGDKIAPSPPSFNPVSPYAKTEKINISGYAEPASEVTLFVNEKEAAKTIAEAGGGTFSFANVVLPKEGKNVITATAADRGGNVSQKSAELVVTLDKKPPELELSSPKNGQTFSGEDQKQVKVAGTTEAGAVIRVNESQTPVLSDGAFSYTFTAKDGENKITIVATDKAGNEKKVELKITYAP